MKKVSIQGQAASYHDTAQKKFFGNGHELVSRTSFRSVFNDVADGNSDYGVVAIENSLYGSINEVYDQLLNNHSWISGEIYLRIHHSLIGVPGADLSDIKEVFSQREALAQCMVWLDKELPGVDIHELPDTAYSVEKVSEWNDSSKAAIASGVAAKHYDLSILEEGIETNKENYTRFIVLSKERVDDPEADKSSIILNLNQSTRAGSLYDALGIFEKYNLNLTKLESRPIPGEIWRYMFYLDIESGINHHDVQAAISKLEEKGHEITILGSYKAGQMPDAEK